ncbi:1-deoxy-D-xylulose 5-phosphate reductoisomerase [Limimonas halophila]|uniref:1-deoxy-D-xylulose 5-phosphate reductoisomerase n=1 Tax=Limimonas halophila TaxID=1082479 RepID=A0A1G7N9G5_9PROT|nr:1-deoxy-D-xylulose 5-phosphate reductoisomerase [Limimonas halophila]
MTQPDEQDASTAMPSEWNEPRTISVLGATGSIGSSTLDLVRRHPEAFRVEALTAGGNVEQLAALAREFGARYAAVADPDRYAALKEALADTDIAVGAGDQALVEAADRPAEWVMAAIVGSAGLAPALAAIRRGVTVALANKETLVCAGELVMNEVARHGATLLPVDSEHNAIFQVLDGERRSDVSRLILTASGGPFRQTSREVLERATPEQAVAHPNWSMGAKISVDSATMMNKGLELIEAHHLFQIPEERIDVLVHPQSIIHSMVAYRDGSTLAQLGLPDMRTPIAHTLAWPGRMAGPVEHADLASIGQLTFEAPDDARFPALGLAREALRRAGRAPTMLNAANEVAVQAFLDGEIGFLGVPETVEAVLDRCGIGPIAGLDDVEEADREARALTRSLARRARASA